MSERTVRGDVGVDSGSGAAGDPGVVSGTDAAGDRAVDPGVDSGSDRAVDSGSDPGLDSAVDRAGTSRRLRLRPAPAGMPDPDVRPPVIAESGDPFAAVRVLDLLARIERGRPVRIGDLVDRLNATHLDWSFAPAVVADAILQLQANWMADYRNASGIVLDQDAYGATITIEESSRVDPWLVRQAQRVAADCRERLVAFSRADRPTGDG